MCGVIVVDAESIGLLVSDVMPICMIIALDIVMTLRGSINCSTVICSPTVIFAILREASSEHYGPQGLLHTIFSSLDFLLRCTFLPGNGARNSSCYLLSLRWISLEEERVMQHSSNKYFPQFENQGINLVGESSQVSRVPAQTQTSLHPTL